MIDKTIATGERRISYARHIARNIDALKSTATVECIMAYALTLTVLGKDHACDLWRLWTGRKIKRRKQTFRYFSYTRAELDNIIRCLYEDRVRGRITPERYDTMASGYEQEQTSLKEKLATVKERIANMDMRESCIREFIAKAKQYVDMPKLTPELLRVFIRKIEVLEKAEKYSRTAGNLIVIHYAFRLPEQDGLPVLEPLMSKAMKETA